MFKFEKLIFGDSFFNDCIKYPPWISPDDSPAIINECIYANKIKFSGYGHRTRNKRANKF